MPRETVPAPERIYAEHADGRRYLRYPKGAPVPAAEAAELGIGEKPKKAPAKKAPAKRSGQKGEDRARKPSEDRGGGDD